MGNRSWKLYAALIEELGKQYDVVIVDSLSQAWSGKDGALDQVDKAAAKAFNNKYAGWRDVTPKHNDMINAIPLVLFGRPSLVNCRAAFDSLECLGEMDRVLRPDQRQPGLIFRAQTDASENYPAGRGF
ncbi:MAG: AAA family ATPase [Caldilineaceae bacterium]|nr:AAA family ATPase [Caldilineaceae bacterium]